jgi:hypothetical protein
MALTEREEMDLLALLELERQDKAKNNYAAYVQYVHEGRWLPG